MLVPCCLPLTKHLSHLCSQQTIVCVCTDKDMSIPVWVKYLRRTMMEEAHSSPAVIHIFQTIVRHADLLYCARNHFATHVRCTMHPELSCTLLREFKSVVSYTVLTPQASSYISVSPIGARVSMCIQGSCILIAAMMKFHDHTHSCGTKTSKPLAACTKLDPPQPTAQCVSDCIMSVDVAQVLIALRVATCRW